MKRSASARFSPSASSAPALDRPARVQEPRGRHAPDARDAGVPVRGVADESEEVGDEGRRHAELRAHRVRVEDLPGAPVDLHDAIPVHALREVLVRRPDADLLDARVGRREARRGRERVVRLELDHGPHGDSHRLERLLERMELREKGALDPRGGLVVRPEAVPEGLDDVVRRHPEVRAALLDRLEDGVQHAGHGAERRVLAAGDAPQAVEVPEQLVRAVEEVDDHVGRPCRLARLALLERNPERHLEAVGVGQ